MARRLPLLVLALATVVPGLLARPAAAAGPTNDPESGGQWGLTDIKAPEAWRKGTGGGIKVAVVSSGIAAHPDLEGKVASGSDATGDDPRNDSVGRGTHLAGIVGARTNNERGIAGVAPDAALVPVKAYDSSISVASYLEAMTQARGSGAQVVLVDIPDGFPAESRPDLRRSLKSLGDAGLSVVVGAADALPLSDLPVLAVAATNSSGSRASTSVTGRGVGAPGQDVLSTTVETSVLPGVEPSYGYGAASGTAEAAAHAAGAVAILRGLGAKPAQAADFLRSTARKNPDTGLGAGIIDVAAAVAAYQAPPPTTATTATTATTTKTAATPTTKALTGTIVPGDVPGLTGSALPGDLPEPGTDEPAVIPEGAEEFGDVGDEGAGGTITRTTTGDDRPLGTLAIGFGLLFGVGGGLSLTFRRLANAATAI